MRHRQKRALALGRRSRSTKFRRGKHAISLVIDSIKELGYSPKKPCVKTSHLTSPCKQKSPMKERKSLKRIKLTSPFRENQIISPNKPSSIKKIKRPPNKKRFETVEKTSSNEDIFIATRLEDEGFASNVLQNDSSFRPLLQLNDFVPIDILNSSHTLSPDTLSSNNLETNDVNNKQLQNDTTDSDILSEMVELAPFVLDNLAAEGLADDLVQFFRLVKNKQYPLDNIAFKLWIEVVKWFGLDNATDMRYSALTKKFWKLGYRQFGGRFINFMSGFKLTGTIANGQVQRGSLPTNNSHINFAVPNVGNLRNYDPYNTCDENLTRAPGFLLDNIESLSAAMNGSSCCITFDGKKLKSGLTEKDGDIDLFGFEKGDSLSQKRERYKSLSDPVELTLDALRSESDNKDVKTLEYVKTEELCQMFTHSLTTLSKNILDAQDLRKKKEYAKEKLIERSGVDNWKNGKYAYAISAMIAYMHDIDVFLKGARSLVDEISRFLSYLNGTQIIEGVETNVYGNENYRQIVENNEPKPTREIKQRSDKWFAARKDVMTTGSSLYRSIGLESLKDQKAHFDTFVCKLPEKEIPPTVKEFMQHGIDNEINATVTLVGKVLPVYFPKSKVYEEGYVEYGSNNGKPFMIISPDGSIRSTDDGTTKCAIELKCPVRDVHKTFPPRYLLQCLCEIEALDVNQCIFLSWTQDISSIFIVKRNTTLFKRAYDMAERLYGTESPKRVTKVHDDVKTLKKDLENACQSNETVEFKTVVSSMKHTDKIEPRSASQADEFCTTRIVLMTEALLDAYKKFYDLNRMPASEAVVFLCCDLDRHWSEGSIRSAPICWFPKGYSLDTDTMRNILEAVLNVCKEKGLHVPAISFDGQWHNINVRGDKGESLTLHQLQKDVWHQAESLKKSAMLKKLKGMNHSPKWNMILVETNDEDKTQKRVIVTEDSSVCLPSFSPRIIKHRMNEMKRQQEKNAQSNQHQHIEEDVPHGNDNVETELSNTITNTDYIVNDSITGLYLDTEGLAEHDDEQIDELISDPNVTESRNQVNEETEIEPNREIAGIDTECVNESIRVDVNEEDAKKILTMLCSDGNCNKKNEWNSKQPSDILKLFNSAESLKKMRNVDLKIIVRYFNSSKLKNKIKESSTKADKLSKLYGYLNLTVTSSEKSAPKAGKKKLKIKSLSELAFAEVSKMKKVELNIAYAEYLWPIELCIWQDKRPAVDLVSDSSEDTNILPEFFFYYPNTSESRKQLEVSCVDSTHLLTRTRRKCCHGGIEHLTNAPWRNVAKGGKTSLSLGMVDAVLEPMSVSVAVTHFTEDVETEMRGNGDIQGADLCRDIREWWIAEDNPGISAEERIRLRMPLRTRLLSYVTFGHFPPPTMYVNGWPQQLWEGILANIDAKILLYGLSRSQSYNVRAFSSMMGETFFSELTIFDRKGRGTVTVNEFARFMSTTSEALSMRLDPNRTFFYRTSRKTAYNLVGRAHEIHKDEGQETSPNEKEDELLACKLHISDHFFDTKERIRIKGKKKTEIVHTERNAVKRGTLGVRHDGGARRNESKVLPTVRMGIDI